MSPLSSPPHALDDPAYRRYLIDKVFAILKAHGSFTRGVYDGLKAKDIPTGGMRELIRQRPFDAVRSEVGGVTITVEITADRQGEQDDPDAVRFACSDLETFRNWFFSLLRRSGMQSAPLAALGPTFPKPTSTIRPDLRSTPVFHRKKKRK
ncbi:hypothetical protein GCM10028808_74610 [Spirosoma migulaei]